jgi:phospholipase/carboxylesterase
MRPLSGPRLPPLTAPASHLVVLVHGYGSGGNDLIGLAPHWQQEVPGAAFIAPNAPDPLPGSPGYQWFPISRIDPHEMQKGVERVGPLLDQFLDAELARLSLPPEKLMLVGFSQGAMLSLHVGLRRATPPAAIVGLSGLLAGPPPPGLSERDSPPVFLAHGDADQVVPVQAMLMAASALGEAGLRVQWHLAHGIGHGVDQATIALAGGFLGLAFRGFLARPGRASSLVKTGP